MATEIFTCQNELVPQLELGWVGVKFVRATRCDAGLAKTTLSRHGSPGASSRREASLRRGRMRFRRQSFTQIDADLSNQRRAKEPDASGQGGFLGPSAPAPVIRAK